jgi:lincosamide nucleotidyltransferase A/C/D/E
VLRQIVRRGYRLVAASPLKPLLRTRLAQRLKQRLVEMPAELVPNVLGALDEVGVRAWLVGGWGVDALLGEQTRRHMDLDVVFDADHDGERRALEAVRRLGFHIMGRERVRTHWWSERIALSNDHGHVVDLHPVSGSAFVATLEAESALIPRGEAVFATGHVGGQPVRCLSAPVQLALHEGYEPTDVDRADIDTLRRRAGSSTQAGRDGP